MRVEEGRAAHARGEMTADVQHLSGKIRASSKRGWDGYVGAAHPELIWISAKQIVRPCTKAELS